MNTWAREEQALWNTVMYPRPLHRRRRLRALPKGKARAKLADQIQKQYDRNVTAEWDALRRLIDH